MLRLAIRLARFVRFGRCVVRSQNSEIHQARTRSGKLSIFSRLLGRESQFKGRVKSVGVTVPGLVTSDGYVVNLPILGWKSLDLLAILKEQVSLPCIVENDANAAAFGAHYTQPSLPTDSTIFLKLGTGCGGAAIINGRLLRGGTGTEESSATSR